jgi:type II secretory pathway component GspD/PulD (secretin)
VGLDGLVDLLESTTDAKTLASPRIHAVSGQAARIQIGEQLGFRITTTTQTSTLESVQFLDVGIVLEVTPRITRDGRVMMRIWPKVSSGEVNVVTGLPSEETTEVETDVLLNSGQGLVIGGLIQEQNSVNVNKLPWLGDIPYAGVLFQNRRQVKSRSEIVVTLRPHVLPYTPNMQARNDELVRRTETPLTYGPLCEFPRPEEPRLPDALFGRRRVPCDESVPCTPAPTYYDPEQDVPLVRLPEVDPSEPLREAEIYEAGRPPGTRR